MSFRESFYQTKQLLVNRLNDFGILSANMNMGWTTLLTIEQNTRITIDVPLNLTYSDEFTITGTLETATYRRLSYKTLKLKVGNTIVDTTETDINGTYSFTTTPVSMGNHSFQVIFEGTNIYNASESSVINRVIGKETSVINLDIIPTTHINGSTIVAGTLKSDDAELIKNATMKMSTTSGNTLTTTTNNYGQFSFTLTDIPDFNNVSITCYFEGDTYYSSSTITTPIAVYQEALELTSDKSILSYADSDYATLTVQYKDEGDMNLGAGRKIDLYKLYEIDNIEVTSDKQILSYVDEDSATITAQLKYGNKNVQIANEPITFTVPSEVYSDMTSIPTQTDSFSMSFKRASGDMLHIYSPTNDDFLYINIGDINTNSQLTLSWDKSNIHFYINGVAANASRIYSPYSGDNTTEWAYSDLKIDGNAVIKNIQIDTSYVVNTDNTGKATLTYDSQGFGDINIGASITGVDGSFQSETYEVLDCMFCDMCPTSNPKWWNQNNAINISTDGDVKVLTTTATGNQYRPATEQTTDSTKVIHFSPSFICEFEVTEITGSWVLQTYDESVNQNPYINSIGRYKIVYDGETAKYYKDDATSPFSQKSGFTGLTAMVGFQCWSSGQTLKYKNFKIYPILTKTYSILDAMFLDDGSSDNSSKWDLQSVTYTQSDDHVTLLNSSGSTKWSVPKVNNSNSNYLDSSTDYCLEVDLKNVSGTNVILILDGTSQEFKNSINISDWTHIRMWTVRSESKVYYQINDNTPQNKRAGTVNGKVQFRVSNGESYSFKNFKLYKI